MTDPRDTDRSSRLILIGLIVLALVTAGAAIVATLGEWNLPDPAASAPALIE